MIGFEIDRNLIRFKETVTFETHQVDARATPECLPIFCLERSYNPLTDHVGAGVDLLEFDIHAIPNS